MKVIHLLLGLILFGALALAGIGGICIAGGVSCMGEPCQELLGSYWLALKPWQLSGLSVALLFFVFAYLLTGLPRRRKAFIDFQNENGIVSVSVDAIRSHLDSLKTEFAALTALKSVLQADRGALAVTLLVGVKQGTQIPELCKMLQARVREVLEEHLGTFELRGVSVEVSEIKAAKKSPEE